MQNEPQLEIIAANLSKAGWSWGGVSAIDSNRRTIWIADAHRGDGKRCLKRVRERNDIRSRLFYDVGLPPSKTGPTRLSL